jgi:DNA-directed RNA polymerase specialized sigma24 family protein
VPDDDPGPGDVNELVTALYRQHATDLIRCAVVMLGDRAMAEDVVQSAEDEALISEEHRDVLAGLRLLPPRQREALALRFLADLDEPEIAELMGVSQGTVKSTVSRGIAALGKHLGASQ